MEIPKKNSVRVDSFGNLWCYIFAPWKFFWILGDSFYTVKNPEIARIQKNLQGAKVCNQRYFARKDENFLVFFKHYDHAFIALTVNQLTIDETITVVVSEALVVYG